MMHTIFYSQLVACVLEFAHAIVCIEWRRLLLWGRWILTNPSKLVLHPCESNSVLFVPCSEFAEFLILNILQTALEMKNEKFDNTGLVILSQFLKKWTRRQENSWKRFVKLKSENPLSSDYDISDFKKLRIKKQQDLSILHLNISYILSHIDDLRTLFNLVNHKFDMYFRK